MGPTRGSGIVLVPLDILRDLPLANSRDDVSRVCAENEEIRERVNAMLGDIAKATTSQRKRALKEFALANADAFNALLRTVLGLGDEAYDAEFDPQGHLVLRQALTAIAQRFPLELATTDRSLDALQGIIRAILDHFKQLVENNNLHELLWFEGQPRKERAAQKLFYGIADAYCKANDIDISPETDHGGGPVDFKFATGYHGRVLVEVKLSMGRVKHGYSTQLKVYQEAASTDRAFFVVIDVGGMGKKLEEIIKIQRNARLKRERAPEIVVIDAIPKPSASKR